MVHAWSSGGLLPLVPRWCRVVCPLLRGIERPVPDGLRWSSVTGGPVVSGGPRWSSVLGRPAPLSEPLSIDSAAAPALLVVVSGGDGTAAPAGRPRLHTGDPGSQPLMYSCRPPTGSEPSDWPDETLVCSSCRQASPSVHCSDRQASQSTLHTAG